MSAPSSQLPLFVPRTAIASERAATQLARRIMSPVRAVGLRATRFADRVVGGWLGTGTGARVGTGERPVARVVPQAGMVMPRPWYELEEEAVALPARRRAEVAAPTVAQAAPAIVEQQVQQPPQTAVERAPEPTVAERGAAIARTHIEAPPEARARLEERRGEVARPVEPTPVVQPLVGTAPESAPVSPTVVAPAATVVPSSTAAVERAATPPTVAAERAATVETPAAPGVQASEPTPLAPLAPTATVAPPTPAIAPRAEIPVAEAAEPRELRAAEALGLRAATAIVETRAAVEAARPRSPIARALHHAEWVDAQLRVLSAPAVEAAARALPAASANYVWVTPAAEAPATSRAQRRVEAPVVETEAPRGEPASPSFPALSTVAPAEARPAAMAPEAITAPLAPTAASVSGLPDLRLEAALPQAARPFAPTTRLAQFIDRLVGTQVGRDVEALPVAFARTAPVAPVFETNTAASNPVVPPLVERAPARELVRLPEAAAPELAEARPTAATENLPTVVTAAQAPSATESRPALESPRPDAALTPRPVERPAPAIAAERVPAPVTAPSQGALRPGAIAMRAEQLAGFVDVRAAAAWGEPLPTVRPAERPAPVFAYVAAPADERRPAARVESVLPRTTESRAATRPAPTVPTAQPVEARPAAIPRPTVESPRVAPTLDGRAAFEPRPARETRSELELVTALAARPTGPAAIARFIDRLVGVGAVRSSAPLPLELAASRAPARAPAQAYVRVEADRVSPAARPAMATSGAAPRASAAAVEPARQAAAPATPVVSAARNESRAAAMPVLRPGGIAVWAEQLAGSIGVRAAGLSIDFVDPSRLPALSSGRASGELTYLWPTVTGEAPVERAAQRVGGAEAPRAASAASFAASAGFAQPTWQLGSQSTSQSMSQPISQEEWALVATFPSAATAIQVAGARRAAQWSSDAPARTLLTASPAPQSRALPSGGVASTVSPAPSPSPGARPPLVTPALQAAERPLVSAPRASESAGGAAASESRPSLSRAAARGGAPSEYVAPSVASVSPAAGDRAMLPGGRMPRGSFTWPRAAGFSPATSGFTPSRTQAAGEAAADAAPGTPLWGSMRPLVSLPGGRPEGSRSEGSQTAGSLDSALNFARPFLELIRGGVAPAEGGSSQAARFVEQSQPVVAATAAPSSEAAAKMVEAVRSPSHAAAGASDDRVSLADLTLISVASATQQVAASATGSSPAATPTASPATESHGGGGGKGGGKAKDDPNEVENLARQVLEELQRQIEIARERSGDPWES